MDIVEFRDAVLVVSDWLRRWVAVPVHGKTPNPRPESFVVVRRIGGTARDQVTDNATLVIESWAKTQEASQALAQRVRGVLFELPHEVGQGVYKVEEFSGPGWFPDQVSNHPVHEWTVSVAVRGRTVAV